MSARKTTLIVSPEASRDFRDIRLYSLQQWGEIRADSYTLRLTRAMESIRSNPQIGVSRSDLSADLRELTIERHVILYRIVTEAVEIARIVHISQDRSASSIDP